jgi:hypothetical protein
MSDISKVSAKTRDLVERASIARQALINDLRIRYTTCETQAEVDSDILVRRISLALKAIDDATRKAQDRTEASTYDPRAAIIISKKTWTKTVVIDDNTRTPEEQNMYAAANQWLIRARKDAGVKTEETRGGSRQPRTPTLVNQVVAETTPANASAPAPAPTFAINMPKPKASSDLSQAIMALATAATKLLNDASQTHALDGDFGLICRNALATMIEAGRAFDASRNAFELKLEAAKPDAPKGARRAAVIAAVKAHAGVRPILEINEAGEATQHATH